MTATRLPFNYLNSIVAEDKVELFMKRHGYRHIGEDSFYTLHLTPSNVILYEVQGL